MIEQYSTMKEMRNVLEMKRDYLASTPEESTVSIECSISDLRLFIALIDNAIKKTVDKDIQQLKAEAAFEKLKGYLSATAALVPELPDGWEDNVSALLKEMSNG